MVLCLGLTFFSKRGENVVYGRLDKLGIFTNILLTLVYIVLSPLYLFLGSISNPAYDGILGAVGWIISTIMASAPLFCGVGIGLSVAWRKKGRSKQSFLVQFAGFVGIGITLLGFFAFTGNLLKYLN